MSINNLYATTDPEVVIPDWRRFNSVKYRSLEIDNDLILQENNYNQEGHILQCYNVGRARFAPKPVLNQLSEDTFGVYQPPLTAANAIANLGFITELATIDFELDPGDPTLIICQTTGLYWVTIKVSKANGFFGLSTVLVVDDAEVLFSEADTPHSNSSANFNSNFTSFLINLDENAEIRLRRSYYPVTDTSSVVLSLPVNPGGNVSTISFIKINT
jgi:hypothetical protein